MGIIGLQKNGAYYRIIAIIIMCLSAHAHMAKTSGVVSPWPCGACESDSSLRGHFDESRGAAAGPLLSVLKAPLPSALARLF